ncbi:uncharacterized protein [Nicotiana tomentosiformis]|uniref:uncharacterized protein n=1 Tax=Nicotiana tomentosiformis TaxID=4098 RepID=UPI00388CB608
MGSLAYLTVAERPLAMDVQTLVNRFVRLDVLESSRVLACVMEQSSLLENIKARQFDDPHLMVLKDTVQRGGAKEVVIGDDGVMCLQGQICVLNVNGLRDLIFEEAYSSRYSIHQVKYEHQNMGGLIQRLEIPEWKWERITIDFVFLPLTEFVYNNNYQSRIQMAPYEALYGRRFHSPVGWFEPGEARLLGTNLVRDALEKVKLNQDWLHTVKSRQKSYDDQRARDVSIHVVAIESTNIAIAIMTRGLKYRNCDTLNAFLIIGLGWVVRTRASSVAEQEPEPQVAATTRGRGQGKGGGIGGCRA